MSQFATSPKVIAQSPQSVASDPALEPDLHDGMGVSAGQKNAIELFRNFTRFEGVMMQNATELGFPQLKLAAAGLQKGGLVDEAAKVLQFAQGKFGGVVDTRAAAASLPAWDPSALDNSGLKTACDAFVRTVEKASSKA